MFGGGAEIFVKCELYIMSYLVGKYVSLPRHTSATPVCTSIFNVHEPVLVRANCASLFLTTPTRPV